MQKVEKTERNENDTAHDRRAKFTYVCTRAHKKHDNPSADNIASESVTQVRLEYTHWSWVLHIK